MQDASNQIWFGLGAVNMTVLMLIDRPPVSLTPGGPNKVAQSGFTTAFGPVAGFHDAATVMMRNLVPKPTAPTTPNVGPFRLVPRMLTGLPISETLITDGKGPSLLLTNAASSPCLTATV